VLKAARALKAKYPDEGLGAHIALEKNLPLASGIGGGSADAAATLRALNGLWRLIFGKRASRHCREIGSDVPACSCHRPAGWRAGRAGHETRRHPPFELVSSIRE
jgi:4-diphosphocytidyl-2-C-methyl-D-erythritol kinase